MKRTYGLIDNQLFDIIKTNRQISDNELYVLNLKNYKMIRSSFQDYKYLKLCKQFFIQERDKVSNMILAPFIPVLGRFVNVENPNHYEINSKILHRSLIKELNIEFINKKKVYSKKFVEIQMSRELFLKSSFLKNISLDILMYIISYL